MEEALKQALKDDFNEDELKEEMAGEQSLSTEISSFYHLVFKLYGNDLLNSMSDSMPVLQEMLMKGHVLQQVAVLNIFADIISMCSQDGIADFAKTLIPAFSKAVKTDDPDLRESAFYIIMAILNKYPELVDDKALCQNIVQLSFEQFNIEDDNGNFESVQDAAAATIIHALMRFDSSHLSQDSGRLYKLWLETCFPLRESEFCGRKIFDAMCELLEKSHQPFIGQNFSNLVEIVKILV